MSKEDTAQTEGIEESKDAEFDMGLITQDHMDWWPDLSDLDRLNILGAAREDRARLLASKDSRSVEQTMNEIASKSGFSFLNEFNLSKNPTKILPLRLIHNFCCLPIEEETLESAKPKILCVDGDESVLKTYRLLLEEDFEVHLSSTGFSALETFKNEGTFAVVLSPVVLPDVSGAEMLSEIIKIDSKVGTLLLTDGSTKEITNQIQDARKFSRILQKPDDIEDLPPVIYQCIEDGGEMGESGDSKLANQGKVKLLTVWPPTERMSRWVFAVSGKKPLWYLGLPEEVIRAITENFGIGADSLDDSDLDLDNEEDQQDDLEDQNAAIIRFVNEVILKAIVDRATDIHFEPHKETLQIRYRIDGQLVPVRVPDNLRSFQDAIISRIKIMGGINISEKRRPQGGRITFTHGQSDLDIRVSTLPTLYGESISLRLLNEKSQPLSMQELGLLGKDEKNIIGVLEKPHGIVLVTGPTGSGKSTSLTAFIRRIHKPERRIMTVEDPVEYEVAGINQTQVNSEIGFNFASALREILRQDPDVIMVGEIRDRETADIAIRASLTGHLVLSTLHTNDAPGAITRLIDMEIEPFLIASSVEMVIAQRLVRRLCSQCAIPADLKDSELQASLALLGVSMDECKFSEAVMKPVGCPSCQNLGYRGRVGIFELMKMSDSIHSLVIKSASAPDIREVALQEGMSTLQETGWAQIKRGLTTFEEVIRYADGIMDEDTRSEESAPTGGNMSSLPDLKSL